MLRTAILGMMTAVSYAVLFRAEIAVRDLFLFTVFSMVLLSGFPFQFSSMSYNMAQLSIINPCGGHMRLSWDGNSAAVAITMVMPISRPFSLTTSVPIMFMATIVLFLSATVQ